MKPEEAIKSMHNLNMVLSITDSERESVGKKYGEHPIVNVKNYCKKCGQSIDWKK